MPQINIRSSSTTVISRAQNFSQHYDKNILYIGNELKNQGYYSAPSAYGHDYISLLNFDKISQLPKEYTIIRANLFVYLRKIWPSYLYSDENKIFIYANSGDFDPEYVNWVNRPNFDYSHANSLNFIDHEDFISCDITDLVSDWHTGLKQNFGLSLVSEDLNGVYAFFDSKTGQHPPYISIDYIQSSKKDLCPIRKDFVENEFIENKEHLHGFFEELYSNTMMLKGAQTVSCFIQNRGAEAFECNLQISPDGITFIDDPQVFTVAACQTIIMAPVNFAKFMRIRIKNTQQPPQSLSAMLWWQIQTNNFYIL